MSAVQQLLTEHLAIWTDADTAKRSGRGRSSGNAASVYGVKKLRELILELAVRGKLVPQDVNDEPASELLKRIMKERDRLIEQEGSRTTANDEIGGEEKYLIVPENWQFCRLGNLARFIDYRGKTPTKVNSGIPLITAKNVRFGYISREPEEYVTAAEYKSWMTRGFPRVGDMLFTTEAPLGNIAIIDIAEKFALAQRVICFQLNDQAIGSYLKIAIMSNQVQKQLIDAATGMTATGIKASKLKEIPVPIPPIAEQHRIVAKVDELMALCDQLETQHNNAAEAHEKIVSVLLSSLTQSADANSFTENWQRIADLFDTLFITESSIDALKQTLLQLAVMGKLAPQNANDEPASKLLQRIQAEKAKLVAAGKIKKDKPLAPISDEEKPFVLPVGWEWARMAEICRPISSGSTPAAENFRYEDGVPFLKVYNIRDQIIDFDYKKQFIEETNHATKLKRSILYPGDVVMNIVGPPLGKVAIIPDSYPEWNCNQAIVFFGLIKPMNQKYIHTFINEGSFLKGIELIGTAGQDNISVTKSQNIPVPIPPVEEQHRIVTKVDELMAICDQLKTHITAANQLQQKLADVVVENALL